MTQRTSNFTVYSATVRNRSLVLSDISAFLWISRVTGSDIHRLHGAAERSEYRALLRPQDWAQCGDCVVTVQDLSDRRGDRCRVRRSNTHRDNGRHSRQRIRTNRGAELPGQSEHCGRHGLYGQGKRGRPPVEHVCRNGNGRESIRPACRKCADRRHKRCLGNDGSQRNTVRKCYRRRRRGCQPARLCLRLIGRSGGRYAGRDHGDGGSGMAVCADGHRIVTGATYHVRAYAVNFGV